MTVMMSHSVVTNSDVAPKMGPSIQQNIYLFMICLHGLYRISYSVMLFLNLHDYLFIMGVL